MPVTAAVSIHVPADYNRQRPTQEMGMRLRIASDSGDKPAFVFPPA